MIARHWGIVRFSEMYTDWISTITGSWEIGAPSAERRAG